MAAAGPGDDPLSDILRYNLPRYGSAADELIRKISRLCSARELDEWWNKEIGWMPLHDVFTRCEIRYAELLQRAKENGWEMPND